jgi:hypothetical protein
MTEKNRGGDINDKKNTPESWLTDHQIKTSLV